MDCCVGKGIVGFCVAEVLWIVILAYTVDCCVAKVLWIFVWLRYCGLLYGLHCGVCG